MRRLPMFPLGSVLFPHLVLPLHVFEDRYRQMIRACLEGDRRFGVVLIDRGSEVGGGDRRTSIGTVAEIIEAEETDDGRWAVLALGRSRIRVVAWAPDDPYPVAVVEDLDDGHWSEEADALFVPAEKLVRRSLALLAELDEPAAPINVEFAPDRVAASWQLSAVSPLGPLDRQGLLANGEPASRMRHLVDLMEEECLVLANRLAAG